MIRSEYDYSFDVQLRLLALMVRKPNLTSKVIEACYFTNPMYADVARIVQKEHEGRDLDSFRLTEPTLKMLLLKMLKQSGRYPKVGDAYVRVAREIFAIDLPDDEILIEEAREFAKDQRYRQALIDAEKALNRKDYKAVQKVMQEAELGVELQRGTTTLPVYDLHHFVREADDADESANHIVFPIIPKGGAALLYGLPKELKSWLAAALAVGAASGGRAVKFFDVPRRVKTLYVQAEDPAFLTRERIKALAWVPGKFKRALGTLKIIPRCGLNLTDPHSLGEFKREIEEFRPELVVLDVFRRLFRGNVADAQETAEFLQILDGLRDTYKCAILLVHHAKKGATPEIQAKALGSVNLTAWADVLLYTSGKRSVGKASVADLQIESKSTTLDQSKLVIVVDSDAYPVVRVVDEGKYEIESLLDCIRENPGLNQEQLEQQSGIPEKKLRLLLKRAVEEGLLREKHGRRRALLYFPLRQKS